MKRKATGAEPDRPASIRIDPTSCDAFFRLLATLTWPGDAERRADLLATVAAEEIGRLEEFEQEQQVAAVAASIRKISGEHDVPMAVLLETPECRQLLQTIASHVQHASLRRTKARSVFHGNGGLTRVARAHGTENLEDKVQRVMDGEGAAVGRVLIYVATLWDLHPDSRPSLNHAWAIFDAEVPEMRSAGVRGLPSDRHNFINIWSKWKCVAHLHAGVQMMISEMSKAGIPLASDINPFEQTAVLSTVLSWSKWFLEFATNFAPQNSRGTLLNMEDVIRIESPVISMRPPLQPLTEAQLQKVPSYYKGQNL